MNEAITSLNLVEEVTLFPSETYKAISIEPIVILRCYAFEFDKEYTERL